MWLLNHARSEPTHNVSAHQLPRYYQRQRVPLLALTTSVTWYRHHKLARTTKILQNFWLTLVFPITDHNLYNLNFSDIVHIMYFYMEAINVSIREWACPLGTLCSLSYDNRRFPCSISFASVLWTLETCLLLDHWRVNPTGLWTPYCPSISSKHFFSVFVHPFTYCWCCFG